MQEVELKQIRHGYYLAAITSTTAKTATTATTITTLKNALSPGQDGIIALHVLINFGPHFELQGKFLRHTFLNVELILMR